MVITGMSLGDGTSLSDKLVRFSLCTASGVCSTSVWVNADVIWTLWTGSAVNSVVGGRNSVTLGVHGGLGSSPTVWQAEETISAAIVSAELFLTSGVFVVSSLSCFASGVDIGLVTLFSETISSIVGDGGGEYWIPISQYSTAAAANLTGLSISISRTRNSAATGESELCIERPRSFLALNEMS
jgi:hypothetical protein